jgi:putative flippase GtrA
MLKRTFANQQFIKFIAVGGFAALINFLSRIALNEFVSFRWAVFLAYMLGMLTAYILSRMFVFDKSGHGTAVELYKFALVNLFAVVQVWLISVGLAEYLFPAVNFNFYANEIAHIIGLSIPIISSFFGHKYYTFKKLQ